MDQSDKELFLSVCELVKKSQEDVAAFSKKLDKVTKDLSKLQKAHKREEKRLNACIAAYDKRSQRNSERRRMPLRTIDLTMDDDEEE